MEDAAARDEAAALTRAVSGDTFDALRGYLKRAGVPAQEQGAE